MNLVPFTHTFKVKTSAMSDGSINQETTDFAGKTVRSFFAAQEEGVRKALIALGWTPPEAESEGIRPDTRRLRYVMQASGIDGFVHVEKDRYQYASECAEAAGREEPNEMDELNGFRLMIDAAIAADSQEPTND